MSLFLHCGAQQATKDEVLAVPTPAKTTTYEPVHHGTLLELVKMKATELLPGYIQRKEQFGLAHGGERLFGCIDLVKESKLEAPGPTGMSIGFRNSYDKSLSVGVAIGQRVFVCDNLAFTTDGYSVLRKHTTNVWKDVLLMLAASMRRAEEVYEEQERFRVVAEGTGLHTERGFALLGVAQGHEVLSAQQASSALQSWREPELEAFRPRTAWSLYNAFTEGLKRGSAANLITRHVAAHEFFNHHVMKRVN